MQQGCLKVDIIGYDCGWGCSDWRCEDGPLSCSADQLLQGLARQGVQARWRGPLGLRHLGNHEALTTKESTLPVMKTALQRLMDTVKGSIEAGNKPVVIGGDHSSAIGTWTGAVAALEARASFGLIWIDAHLDAHTYETSYQGKWGGWWHGQPVTALTGSGLPEFVNLGGRGQKISPQHLCIIGAHSYEPAEQDFIQKNGIRVFYLDEVKRRGFAAVFAEARTLAGRGTSGFGMTVDLDAFRPEDAPGVGSCEADGLAAADVLPIIRSLGHDPAFRVLEVAEFNPHKDIGGKTGRLLEKVIESVFTKD